jgi:ribosomal protein S18 acetylase RimI-like enzyme
MATTEADPSKPMADLAHVRRIEAVGFRSFPSTTTHYDGTWAIRLTAGHPSKRLNSVTPLDPGDVTDLERRVELARRRFEAMGRPLVFRLTPLSPPILGEMLDRQNWVSFDETIVMAASLERAAFSRAVDQVPLQDVGRWVDAWLALSSADPSRKPGMVEVISSIKAESDLFLVEEPRGTPVSAVRCVRDGDLAGIFEMATDIARRRQGHAMAVLGSALKWAVGRGAATAWLQVVSDNAAALALYRRFGFFELYRYDYRRAPQ